MRERRLVSVDSKRKGWFHGFVNESRPILEINIMVRESEVKLFKRMFEEENVCHPGCRVIQNITSGAIIEYLDGTVEVISPVDRIKFL